jgi:hypothetical protein
MEIPIIEDERVIFISDGEGSNARINEPDFNGKVDYVGDLFDSVGNIDDKCFNLRNMVLFKMNYDQYTLKIGNRDINKIKFLPLGKLQPLPTVSDSIFQVPDPRTSFIMSFNFGECDLSYDFYSQLKDIVTSQIGEQAWISDMKSFYPFWNTTLMPFQPPNTKWDEIDETINLSNKNSIFFNRLNYIIGVDGKTGTMSAPNLLYSIPKELGYVSETDYKDDYYAFIVLAIFNSLLCITI